MSNSTMLTQTHMQQFNELTSSKQRSSELVKEPALIFVCYFTSHTGVLTGSRITFHWPPTCFWCSRSSRWVLHLWTSRKCRGETCSTSPGCSWAAALWKAPNLCGLSWQGKRRGAGTAICCICCTTRLQLFSAKQEMPKLTSASIYQPQAQYSLYISSESNEAAWSFLNYPA